jgi:hypothetical protein
MEASHRDASNFNRTFLRNDMTLLPTEKENHSLSPWKIERQDLLPAA